MVRVIPPKPKKKITRLFIILLSALITFHVFGLTKASAEFVPYDIPVFEREILGSEQYTDYEENKTFIKYNYVGQEVETEHKENIISVNTEKLQDNKYKIYSGNQFIFTNNDWHYLETATTTIENFNELTTEKISLLNWINPFSAKEVNADTVYADSNDGYCRCKNAVWSSCQTGTTGSDESSWTSAAISSFTGLYSGNYYIGRIQIPFDLSGVTETIASATLNLYPNPSHSSGGIYIMEGTYDDSPGTDWYDDFDADPIFGHLSDTSSGNYNVAYLTDGAVTYLNSTDDVKLFVRHENDYENNPTTYVNTHFYSSESTGTTYDPYLEIIFEEEEEEEETATSTTSTIIPGDLPFLDDITIITGLTEHYESSTTSPDYFEMHYYRIPFIGFLVFAFIFLYIGSRVLLELIIRWRK